MKISKNAQKILAKANELAKEANNEYVELPHIIAALMELPETKYFRDSIEKVGVSLDAITTQVEEDCEELSTLTSQQIALLSRMGTERKIMNSRQLAAYIDGLSKIASKIGAGQGWNSNSIEITPAVMVLGLFMSNTKNALLADKCINSKKKANAIVNDMFREEAKAEKKPFHELVIQWDTANNKDKDRSAEILGALFGSYAQAYDDDYEYDDDEDDEEIPFCTNLIKLAEEDSKPFIGRVDELNSLIQCLERMDKPNAILAGEPGVGKTDVIRGLAKKLHSGDVPVQLKDSQLYSVDIAGMVAGSQYRGQFEKKLKSTIETLSELDRPIVFIDEVHTVLGAGATSSSSMDAANILKPYLTTGKIRVVGATTAEEYRKHVEGDSAFMRRFQKIDVVEPSSSDTVKIIKGSKVAYENFHKVSIPVNAIEKAVSLSVKHMHDRFLPDKAIDIIDQACSMVKLDSRKKVTIDDIETVVSKLCKIPKQTVEKDELSKVRNLESKISAQVFGQDEAIAKITDAIQMAKVGLNDETKPVGTFLFVGPSGVGKTEIAKQLANQLENEFIRFDMSEYGEAHSAAKLIGAPAGYVGYEDGGILVEKVRKNPNAVILFDEIEKAHPDVFKTFLQIFDYGMLSDNKGRKADFRNCVIIMTSNAGNSFVEKHVGFNKSETAARERSMDAIKRIMPPELLGRIDVDNIIQFNPINDAMAHRIVKKGLKELTARLKAKGCSVTFTDAVIEELSKRGISAEYGARKIQRTIDTSIKKLFKNFLMNGSIPTKCTVDLIDGDFKVVSNDDAIITSSTETKIEETIEA